MNKSPHFFLIVIPFILLIFSDITFNNFSTIDPVTIEFKRGRGTDCFGQGRECFSMESITLPSDHSQYAEGIGVVYFNTNGQFVLEVTNAIDSILSDELSNGVFILDSNVAVPTELLIEMGNSSQTVILNNGVYNAEVIDGNIYRIIFT